MSVNIAVSASSMPQSLDSLKVVTPLDMHRIAFNINTLDQWYGIMAEARRSYGKNWRGQPKVKRRLESWRPAGAAPIRVWFEVPDPSFATWCAVKLGVEPVKNTNK